VKEKDTDIIEFDGPLEWGLAELAAAGADAPAPEVRHRLMQQVAEPEAVPAGFAFRYEENADWVQHPVPGIRMRVLAINKRSGYATLLLDVAPGTRFPPHHHTGDEECYIVSGSAYSYGRRMGPGDFLHADAHTDHGELYTEEGCRVILIAPPEDYMPAPRG
jgi:quercetin dioxygenase-like cupin family protein